LLKRADDNPFYVSTKGRFDCRSARDVDVGIRVDTFARARPSPKAARKR
jgi:hypothetical protein